MHPCIRLHGQLDHSSANSVFPTSPSLMEIMVSYILPSRSKDVSQHRKIRLRCLKQRYISASYPKRRPLLTLTSQLLHSEARRKRSHQKRRGVHHRRKKDCFETRPLPSALPGLCNLSTKVRDRSDAARPITHTRPHQSNRTSNAHVASGARSRTRQPRARQP